MTSLAQNAELRNRKISPTRVSLGVVSIDAYIRLIINLVQRYQWSSIYLVLDISVQSPLLPDIMQAYVAALQSLPEVQVTAVYKNLTAEVDFDSLLADFRSSSRGMESLD